MGDNVKPVSLSSLPVFVQVFRLKHALDWLVIPATVSDDMDARKKRKDMFHKGEPFRISLVVPYDLPVLLYLTIALRQKGYGVVYDDKFGIDARQVIKSLLHCVFLGWLVGWLWSG